MPKKQQQQQQQQQEAVVVLVKLIPLNYATTLRILFQKVSLLNSQSIRIIIPQRQRYLKNNQVTIDLCNR